MIKLIAKVQAFVQSKDGATAIEYTFTTSTTDPEGEDIYYKFDWGDGTISDWIGPYTSGATGEGSYTWSTAGIYDIRVKAKDINEAESDWSEQLNFNVYADNPGFINSPPNTANKPTGPSNLETGERYTFKTVSTDPESHTIYYHWDINDDLEMDVYSVYYDSGEEASVQLFWSLLIDIA